MPAPEVFISYSRSDSSAAQALRAHLTTVGTSTFLDRYALPAGQPWQPQLEQAIARCDSMAVLLGPSGIGTWQQREIQLGLDRQAACEKTNRPFPVLPVLLQGLDDRDVPLGRFLGLNTWIDLRSSLDDPEALQRLIAGIQGQAIDTVARDPRLAGLCPYRGLLPFREEDAGLFFGRRRYIDELVQKVRQRSPANLVAVVGRSGSGKSSIVYAGLLPALRKERGLGNDAVWDMVALRPGSEPLHALIDTFDPPPEEVSRTQKLAQINDGVELLRAKKVSLAQLIRDRLKDEKSGPRGCCSTSISGKSSIPRRSPARSGQTRTSAAPTTRGCSSTSCWTPPPRRPARWSSPSAPTSIPTSRATTVCAKPSSNARSASGR